MTIESVIQNAMVDLSGVELTMEHIAELTLSMAGTLKNQTGISLSQKIEMVKASLRTFVLTHTTQVSESTKKLLVVIDTKVGETVAAELREPLLRRIMNSVYGLFWPSAICSKSVSDCSGSDCSGSEPVVIQDEIEVAKKACSISCCSKNLQVEEPVFTTLVEAVEPIVEAVEPVVEAVEAVVEAVEPVKTSTWCQPKKGKKKAKKNGVEDVKEPEVVKESEVEAVKEPEAESVKELEVVKESEVESVKEPEAESIKEPESVKEPEAEVAVPENPPEPIQPENLSIYK